MLLKLFGRHTGFGAILIEYESPKHQAIIQWSNFRGNLHPRFATRH